MAYHNVDRNRNLHEYNLSPGTSSAPRHFIIPSHWVGNGLCHLIVLGRHNNANQTDKVSEWGQTDKQKKPRKNKIAETNIKKHANCPQPVLSFQAWRGDVHPHKRCRTFSGSRHGQKRVGHLCPDTKTARPFVSCLYSCVTVTWSAVNTAPGPERVGCH